MTVADRDTSICPHDQSPLLDMFDANEHGIYFYFVCSAPDPHTFPSMWAGGEWLPDFSEVDEDA